MGWDRLPDLDPASVGSDGLEVDGWAVFAGDSRSAQWGSDTQGWMLRAAGSAEFNEITVRGAIYAESGELGTLTVTGTITLGTGGKLRTAASGNRVEIAEGTQDRIAFYTGGAAEVGPGVIRSDTGATGYSYGLYMFAPQVNSTTQATYVSIHDEPADNSLPAQVRVGYMGGSTLVPEFKIQGGMKLMVEDGSDAAPSVTFNNDTDLGIYRSGANAMDFAANGSRVGTFSYGGGSTGSPSLTVRSAVALSTSAGVYSHDTRFVWSVGNALYLDFLALRYAAGGGGGSDHNSAPIIIRRQVDATPMAYLTLMQSAVGVNVGDPQTYLNPGLVVYAEIGLLPGTTATGANTTLIALSGGVYAIRRFTSSERYKRNIVRFEGGRSVLDLTPVWFEGQETTIEADEGDEDHPRRVAQWTGQTHLGITAEDVAEHFPAAAVYDDEGRPDSYGVNELLAGLLYEVKLLRDRVQALEGTG